MLDQSWKREREGEQVEVEPLVEEQVWRRLAGKVVLLEDQGERLDQVGGIDLLVPVCVQ